MSDVVLKENFRSGRRSCSSPIFIWAGFFLLVLIFGCASPSNQLKVSDREIPLVRPDFSGRTTAELPALNEQSGLSDYLAYAALNNPGLQAAFLRWKAALERIPQVKALPDPRFNYGYFIQSVETRVGPQNQRFALLQTFPWFGKLELQGNAAAEAARAEQQRYEAAKLKLFYDVKDAFYEYYYLARAISITQENSALIQDLEAVARTQYAAGYSPYANIIRAQVEIGKLEDRVRTLQDLREPIVAKLNAAMNRPTAEPLPWPGKIVGQKANFTREQLLAWLKAKNPDLKTVDFLAASEKQKIALARKAYFPDVTLGIEAIDTGEALNRNTPDSGKDAVVASLSINLPIWWNKYKAGEREAQARYKAYLDERVDRQNRLEADLKLAVYRYEDAERKINLYRDTLIPKAMQSIEVTLQSYEAGMGSFLDLIDSVRSLLEFQLAYERAFADREQRLAEIEMLVGTEVPKTMDTSELQQVNLLPLEKKGEE